MPKIIDKKEDVIIPSEDKAINNSSLLEKTALIAVDYPKKDQVKSNKNKRKFVCIELDSKANKLITRKYDNNEFLRAIELKSKIYLALYVKVSEQSDCYKEVDKMLKALVNLDISFKNDIEQHKLNTIEKIKGHFRDTWENYNDTYENYLDLSNAYDKNTGQPINNIVTDLAKVYLDIEKQYEKNKAIYGDRAESLKSNIIRDEEKYEQNRMKYQHLESNTVSSVEIAFNTCVSRFNEEVARLKQEDANTLLKTKYSELKKSVDDLHIECINSIPKGTVCNEDLINKKRDISKGIELLLETFKKLENDILTEQEIKGLQIKYQSFVGQVASLKDEIQKLLNVVDEQERQTKAAMLDIYFKPIKSKLSDITVHQQKTSKVKKEILERIITDVQQLENEIKLSIKDAIQDKVSSIVSYINENYNNLATPRGVFASVGTSGSLVWELKSALEKFMSVVNELSSEQAVDSENYSTQLRP